MLTDSEYFWVIIHGDLWVNNILFQYYESVQSKELKFIDFQNVSRGNIYQDLKYFVFTSPTSALRKKNLNELLNTLFRFIHFIYNVISKLCLKYLFCDRSGDNPFHNQFSLGMHRYRVKLYGTLVYDKIPWAAGLVHGF